MRQTAHLMLDQAARSKLVILEGWAHYWLGLAGYYRNELDTAGLHLRELVERRYVIHAMAARNGMIALARVYLAMSETAQAWQTTELLSQYDMARVGYEPDDARSLRALLHLSQGDVENALRWADGYTTPVPDEPLTWLQDPHSIKARVLLARGAEADAQSALDIMDALCEIAERTYNTRGQIEFLAVRALALDAVGRASETQAALRQAVELSRPGGFIRPFVDVGPHMADMLGRLATQGFAVETIRRILAAFPDQREALEPSDLRSVIRNPQSAIIEPLTMREVDVLLLLHERLSNKEIAAKLYLSPATVKRHLINIYGKLGVNRRRDAVLKAETLGLLPRR
jgi:LuxR family maltose regulon positive regulatory protein